MTKNSEREGTEKTKRVQETILDVTKSSEERKNRGCRKGKWIKRTRMKKRLSSVILYHTPDSLSSTIPFQSQTDFHTLSYTHIRGPSELCICPGNSPFN